MAKAKTSKASAPKAAASVPANPVQPLITASEPPDIYAAVKAFVLAYALPQLPAEAVYQGWQNRAALPAGSNEYAVMSILWQRPVGTTVSMFATLANSAKGSRQAPQGAIEYQALTEVAVQVDFYSEGDTARQRAANLQMMAKTAPAVELFSRFGLSSLYADDVRDLSFVGDAQQFVRRASVTLHLSTPLTISGDETGGGGGPGAGLSIPTQYFDQARLSGLENVDAHHPEKD